MAIEKPILQMSLLSPAAHRLGYSIWETIHQWPAIHVCGVHDRLLISAPKSFHNKAVIGWHLPHDELVTHWPEQQGVCVNALEILSRISNWSIYLTKYDHNPLDSNLLRILYHLQARKLGFVDLDGSIKFQQIRKKFMHEYNDIISIKGFEFLSNVYKDHGGMLGVTLKQYSGDKSPLIQTLMIDFLFDSHTSFSNSYQQIQTI